MNTDEARTRLLTERARIEALRQAAGRLTADAQEATERELSSAEQHPSELASETIGLELDQSVAEARRAGARRARGGGQARRLGSYGNCEACGKPIGEARLEAIPTARFCIEDQSKQDRGRRNGR